VAPGKPPPPPTAAGELKAELLGAKSAASDAGNRVKLEADTSDDGVYAVVGTAPGAGAEACPKPRLDPSPEPSPVPSSPTAAAATGPPERSSARIAESVGRPSASARNFRAVERAAAASPPPPELGTTLAAAAEE
jgi:hypothetical protein